MENVNNLGFFFHKDGRHRSDEVLCAAKVFATEKRAQKCLDQYGKENYEIREIADFVVDGYVINNDKIKKVKCLKYGNQSTGIGYYNLENDSTAYKTKAEAIKAAKEVLNDDIQYIKETVKDTFVLF